MNVQAGFSVRKLCSIILVVIFAVGTAFAAGSKDSAASSAQPKTMVGSWAELKKALFNAKEGDIICLSKNIVDAGVDVEGLVDGVSGATVPIAKKGLVLDGNGKTIKAAPGKEFRFDVDGLKSTVTDVTIKNLTIDGACFNKKIGGAIFVQDGTSLLMDNVTMKNCFAGLAQNFGGGGAIYVNDHGSAGTSLIAKNCVFENNSAGPDGKGRGGAIYANNFRSESMSVVIEKCTFKGNKAGEGGAVAVDGITNFSISGCTFEKNSATLAAEDIYVFEGVSQGKKNMAITSKVTAKIASNTHASKDPAAVIFGRYYPADFTGEKATAPVGALDVSFTDAERTKK